MKAIRHYWYFFLGCWVFYLVLLPIVSIFKLYEYFPAIGIIGYGVMVLLNLIAITECQKRYDYILLSISLITIGVIATIDMVINKQSMMAIWIEQLPSLTPELAEDYMQVLIILLNIFTGSNAAQCLFHGLNKRAFDRQGE